MSEIKNVRGGGLGYVKEYSTPESRLFKAGLKQDPTLLTKKMVKGQLKHPSDYHDKLDYERGVIVHSRSYVNQQFLFHYMYGGFKKFFVERYLKNHFYKKMIRKFWPTFLLGYCIGCYGMRKYDTAAYNFFYFSD